ncbi:DUF1176 domain-containing protein [Aureimonas sp. SK2]|uniref:DUF1176 domain-containing protein n=1 Tax=Aureimonas sp. SK2 TaxID=3015992 RepID=UPI0024444837|nr:DUF1176 domain-containing protein [Aureimonas sp. SK2]
MKLRILAGAALLAALSPAAAERGGSFRDWTLSCTPGLLCTAATFPQGGRELTSFGLERGASEDAPVRLLLGLGEDHALSGDVAVKVDGADTLTLPASAFTKDTETQLSARHEGIRAILVPRFKNGTSVEVTARLGGRDVSQVFSLSGVVATLRKMDDDQRRIGTQTALVDRGDKPLPDRSALPQDVAAPDDLPAPVRALWEGAGGCSDRDPDAFGDLGFSVPFGTDARLFVLACGMPGAYNAPSRLFSLSGDAADIVPLATMTADGPAADLMAWNVDLQGDRLSSFFKGRGIGDCGQTATWRIDTEAGAVILTEAREKADCDGEGGDPAEWPLLWPKR